MLLISAVQVCLDFASVLKLLRSCIDLNWVMLQYQFLNMLCFFSIIMSLCKQTGNVITGLPQNFFAFDFSK